MLSLSAHKFHGPRGVGALYCRKGLPLVNIIEGGAQERGKRAGTENTPAIVGMTVAMEEACARNGVLLSSIAQSRFTKGVSMTKQAIADGLLGKLVCADVYMKFNRKHGSESLSLGLV